MKKNVILISTSTHPTADCRVLLARKVIDGRTCIMIDDVSFGLGFLCSWMCDLE